jgi:hypothetical protein
MDKYWIGINVGAWAPLGEKRAPVPMSCDFAAVEQTGSSKEHRAGADRADSPSSSGDLSEPLHYFKVYLVALNCASTGNEQGVDLSAHLPKRLMRCDSQPTVRNK